MYVYALAATLEDCTILEKISADTLLFLQTHKRIWPASQRDAQFWSHMRKITDGLEPGTCDMWVVCNNSTDYAKQEVGPPSLTLPSVLNATYYIFFIFFR